MSAEQKGPISVDAWLYTLKGKVVVHFVDGQTLEGELVKQDVLNFFLQVEDEPWLVPRSQVLFIQAAAGQPIEPDTESLPLLEEAGLSVPPSLAEIAGFDTAEVSAPPPADDLHTVIEEPSPLPDTDTAPPPVDLLEELESLVEAEPAEVEEEEEGDTFLLQPSGEESEQEVTSILTAGQPTAVTARLVCTTGPHAGEEFELREDIVTLGRATDNDISLPLDKEISRRHARFQREGDKYVIYDQNSLNGVFINARRITESGVLNDGDVILVGVTNIEYHEEQR
ncbi:MAG: FHA domain-containing protein [Chloroflexi bacterium]|nr:MAG: FHA domain-containing protein [Chloroflexota bacterium]